MPHLEHGGVATEAADAADDSLRAVQHAAERVGLERVAAHPLDVVGPGLV